MRSPSLGTQFLALPARVQCTFLNRFVSQNADFIAQPRHRTVIAGTQLGQAPCCATGESREDVPAGKDDGPYPNPGSDRLRKRPAPTVDIQNETWRGGRSRERAPRQSGSQRTCSPLA